VFHPIDEVPLNGGELVEEPVAFEPKTWMNETWQQSVSDQALLRFGFRAGIVRFYNQLVYSLLGQSTNENVALGNDGFLFEKSGEHTVSGRFFDRERADSILTGFDHAKAVFDSLGKRVVVVMCPNKWRSAKAHTGVEIESSDESYHQTFINHFKSKDYEYIDCVDWFASDFETCSPPLHSKLGKHWSVFGGSLVADSLFSLISKTHVLPGYTKEIEWALDPRNSDNDLHRILNLMSHSPKEELAYPHYQIEDGRAPRVLVIGDSYYWTMFYLQLHQSMFDSESKFFYYNNSVAQTAQHSRWPLNDDIRTAEIMASDVVLVFSSEPNLVDFGFGFFEFVSTDFLH